jgi:FixJ family two-component response regulator
MPAAAVARTIYIIDADPSVREGLSRVVDSAGLRPKRWSSIDAFLLEMPDAGAACALLDVSTLSHCEPALWRRLQALAAAVPVIALSARDDPATQRLARALGAQAFFHKPVDARALLDSIDWVTRAESAGLAR